MEIFQQIKGDQVELRLVGRLDAYSAEHLTAAVQQIAREGKRQVQLEMAGMTFLSSAGIRSLLKAAREMRGIGGEMAIVNPSNAVMEVLQLARLEMLVKTAEEPVAPVAVNVGQPAEPRPRPVEIQPPHPPAQPTNPLRSGTFEEIGFRVLEDRPERFMTAVLHGEPSALGTRLFTENDCREVEFPEPVIGLGLAGLGDGFDECRSRFGEFIAAGGAFAYQATDRGQRADYLATTGQLVPKAQVLYGIEARGEPAISIGFDTHTKSPAKLSDLTRLIFQEASPDGQPVVFAMIAEARGLLGVSLKKSLALATNPTEPTTFPQVRQWMNFTTEPVYCESVTLVAGVITSAAAGALESFVRPMCPQLKAHIHAAAFSYKPLRKDLSRMPAAIDQLFEEQALRGVMHLLTDCRPINGNGESLFVRGTIWAGRLQDIKTQGSKA